jgi:hypothetical protein
MVSAFLRGLEKAPTFLVPIINPPFADNSPHFSGTPGVGIKNKEYPSCGNGQARRSFRDGAIVRAPAGTAVRDQSV